MLGRSMTNTQCFPRTMRVLAGEVSPSRPHQPHHTGLRQFVFRTELPQLSVPMVQVGKGIYEISRVMAQIPWSEWKGFS